MARPDFDAMWSAFPDHDKYPTLADLYRFIGGRLAQNIDLPGFGPNGNTCASRMSRALNYGGAPVDRAVARQLKLSAVSGGDGKAYLFRVADLRAYLKATLGTTPEVVRHDFPDAFPGRRGIVAFKVNWADATGHIALWDRTRFREAHDDYRSLRDDPATPIIEPRVEEMLLWEL